MGGSDTARTACYRAAGASAHRILTEARARRAPPPAGGEGPRRPQPLAERAREATALEARRSVVAE
eukprot:360725-Pyramimonas_sp.AAC.1